MRAEEGDESIEEMATEAKQSQEKLETATETDKPGEQKPRPR